MHIPICPGIIVLHCYLMQVFEVLAVIIKCRSILVYVSVTTSKSALCTTIWLVY
ncbi:hypothetical protein BJ878DRAFT_513925 [Calycina marina]|uniref:Uncharacterized protein n=1 Tax=Calycina marina TaxID=1763456 RepID=A0A9P7YZN2_9HELO|nr:hypothetical protein BJ878DRAFT_513925 [Calycina marina]